MSARSSSRSARSRSPRLALAASRRGRRRRRRADDVDAALQTLTPAEAVSVDELPHGLLQKVRAWLRGEA